MDRRDFFFLTLGGAAGAMLPRISRGNELQSSVTEEFERIVSFARKHKLDALPIGEAIDRIGESFLGTPYVANTLDINDRERCVINFTGLDCVTFFELSLDLARIVKASNETYSALVAAVTYTRYRSGHITDYTSRLHYTSDWIYDNVRKGVVSDLSRNLGGVPFDKKIAFMTTHAQSYRQLRDHPEFIPVMREIERQISHRDTFYIPKANIAAIEKQMRDGDIIAFTSAVPGLDCAHTGLALIRNGKTHLLHASSEHKNVVVSDGTVAEYVSGIEHDTGIMIARPLEVRAHE